MNVTRRKHVFHRLLSVMLSLTMVLGSMVGTGWEITYADELGETTGHVHEYDENGFCTAADCTQPYQQIEEGTGTQDDPYLISNGGQLYYFGAIVNGTSAIIGDAEKNTKACAKLTADITWNAGLVDSPDDSLRVWMPMYDYEGTFEGDGHTISGLYVYYKNISNAAGLFASMKAGSICRNVGIVNSYLYSCLGAFGSVTAVNYGTIENCYSTATLGGKNTNYAGGLVGCGESNSVVRNSYYAGTISIENDDYKKNLGGITGKSSKSYQVENTCENCYYNVSGMAVAITEEGAQERTMAQFATGQVAYELNGDQSKIVFGQTLSGETVTPEAVQTLPVLGGQRVCKMGNFVCPGDKTGEGVSYINGTADGLRYRYQEHNCDKNAENPYLCKECNEVVEHECSYEKGVCRYCGSIADVKGDGTAQNPYQIQNEVQLKWFVQMVNEEGNEKNANAVLVEDISLNPEGVTAGSVDASYWEAIEAYPAGAVFDGQGHTISGMCYKAYPNAEGSGSGLVKDNKGTIRNMIITGASVKVSASETVSSSSSHVRHGIVCAYNKGVIEDVTTAGVMEVERRKNMSQYNTYTGGICGRNEGTISGCTSYCTISGSSNYTGGIAGSAYNGKKVENCSNYGKVSGTQDVGGIIGYAGYSNVRNCSNYGRVSGTQYVGGIIGYSSYTDVENCCNYAGISGEQKMGGICGMVYGTDIITCLNTGKLTTSQGIAGGIVGKIGSSTQIRYSCNMGSIESSGTNLYYYVGGVIGSDESSSSTTEVCYYLKGCAGSGVGFDVSDKDGYESKLESYTERTGVLVKESDAFKSGEVVWNVNHAAGEDLLYQKDDGIVLACSGLGGYRIARHALFGCSGCTEPISAEYVRDGEDVDRYVYRVHNYDSKTLACTECGKVLPHLCIYGEDGYCTICHGMHSPDGEGTEEKPYEISNAAELYWFAGVVNGSEDVCKNGIRKNTEACAVLTEDIVVNDAELSAETTGASVWVPMGMGSDWSRYGEYEYRGCFDGQGHTITGIYIPEGVKGYNGFFAFSAYEAQIRNLNLKNVYIAGFGCAGGICAYAYGNDTRIEGCSVSGVIAGAEYAGGIVGITWGDVTIRGCHNMAQITAKYAGGIVSYLDDYGCLEGSYNTGIVSGAAISNGIIGDLESSQGDVYGCYYLQGSVSGDAVEVTRDGLEIATEEEFASGKVTYGMNRVLQSVGCESGYGQILTGEKVQKFPVWKEETKVYAVGTASCPGVEVSEAAGFSNDSTAVSYEHPNHLYENDSYFCTFCHTVKEHTCEYIDGSCKYCGVNRKPEGEGTKESPYRIGNAKELFWFRDKVSGDLTGEEANPAACAVLTADIDIQADAAAETVYWTPAGVSENTGKVKEYMGTFDGQGHIISGVAVVAEDGMAGVFGKIGTSGVIQNLHITGSEQQVLLCRGAIVGAFCNVNNGIISGCSIEADVVMSEAPHVFMGVAGMVGTNTGSIINSEVSGSVISTEEDSYGYSAGICITNEGNIIGCENRAELENEYAAGICCYNEGTVRSCRNEAENIYGYCTAGICIENEGTIEESCNAGTVSAGTFSCGICGENVADGTIRNCWNEGSAKVGICYQNEGEIKYCFHVGEAEVATVYGCYGVQEYCFVDKNNAGYTYVYGKSEEDNGTVASVPEELFKNGYIAYMLNTAQGKDVFGQVLSGDAVTPAVSEEAVQAWPVAGGKKVYPVGTAACPGCLMDAESGYVAIDGFSNRPGQMTYQYPEHCYNTDGDGTDDSVYCKFCHGVKNHDCTYENGICALCGKHEVPEGDGTKEHPYEIGNAGQLYAFAGLVGDNAAACAVLTADIDMTAVPDVSVPGVSADAVGWTAIGLDTATVYEGTFDGAGYTISGLCGTGEIVSALFARTGTKAVVKNVSLTDCDIRGILMGGISAFNEGTIENCSVDGFVAYKEMTKETEAEYYAEIMWFRRLYGDLGDENLSDVIAGSVAGGICGWNKGSVQSCFFSGTAVAKAGSYYCLAGYICGMNDSQATITNCYYYSSVSTQEQAYITANALVTGKGIGTETKDLDGQTMQVTQEDIHSGKVAWMLDTDNSYDGNKGIWKQDVNTSMPTVASDGAVTLYYLFAEKLDGSTVERYVPAGADIGTYVQNAEGAMWIFSGRTGSLPDGTIFIEKVMNYPVVCIKEAHLPTGTVTIGEHSWTQFVKSDSDDIRLPRNLTLDVAADSADTQIEYYIHTADSRKEATLSLEELVNKTFTTYDAASKPVLSDSAYTVVYVKLTNADGLVNYICTDSLIVEKDKLLSITAPADITGVTNGTKKDAASLGLPATVAITTEYESITSAEVTWDLEHLVSGSYDSTLTTKQTFAVKGTVVLPDGVDANGIALTVQVQVTVDAKQAEEPTTSGAPIASGGPAESGAPIASGTPIASGIPIASGEPAESGAPIASGTPIASGMPVASGTPIASGMPVASGEPIASGEPGASEEIVKGDADDSGKIDLKDAQLALKIALKLVKADEKQTKTADVDNDGNITLKDAQLILKYALKLIKSFD